MIRITHEDGTTETVESHRDAHEVVANRYVTDAMNQLDYDGTRERGTYGVAARCGDARVRTVATIEAIEAIQ